MTKNFIAIFLVIFFARFIQCDNNRKSFVVVLDPGHGGSYIQPQSIYGDKFNRISFRHSDSYRPGASYQDIWEQNQVYLMAVEVKRLLDLTQNETGREEFTKILHNYSNQKKFNFYRMEILFSRVDGFFNNYNKIKNDVNGPYRLYDYHDYLKDKTMMGTISRINALKPNLVVTMHLTSTKPKGYGGLNSVITPGFTTYKKAIEYVKAKPIKRREIRKKFLAGPFRQWFLNGGRRDRFESFLTDAWIYFNGYWSIKNGLHANLRRFRGFRHNMLTWNYSDSLGWEEKARLFPRQTSYSRDLRTFKLEGAFWQREQNQYESFRREGGYEKRGGDNFYASQEILRFVRKGLLVNNIETVRTLPVMLNPYISTWSMPTYTNAINAFLELGHLRNSHDFKRIIKYNKIYAQSIAVAIYSLFHKIILKRTSTSNMPRGKKINWKKYGNYFNEVVK